MSSQDHEFIISYGDERPEILRQRFQELGYLLMRRYVPEQRCNAMLEVLLEQTAPHVTKAENASHPHLSGSPFFETDPTWDEVYPKIQAQESFHRFFHESPIRELMELVSNDRVFVYPMKMARIATPGKIGFETPPHQDAHSHNAGPTMAGIWVALHPVASNMGRLKVLPGSHKRGKRPVFSTQGVGGVQCEIYDDESTWHVSDFETGDVLIFHSCTVHKAEPNTHPEAVRISIDTRFCNHGAPVFSTNLEPHHGWRIEGLDWDAIYTHWTGNDYQYYWRDYPNLF